MLNTNLTTEEFFNRYSANDIHSFMLSLNHITAASSSDLTWLGSGVAKVGNFYYNILNSAFIFIPNMLYNITIDAYNDETKYAKITEKDDMLKFFRMMESQSQQSQFYYDMHQHNRTNKKSLL